MLLARITSCRSCVSASLCGLRNSIFLGTVARVVMTLLCMRLTYLLWIAVRDLSTEEDRDSTAVESIQHLLEDIERLQFVNKQWVFLLVACVLNRLFEFIQLAQVIFPLIINYVEHHSFLKLTYNFLTLSIICCFEINCYIIDLLAIRDRNKDILVHCATFLIHLFDNRICHLLKCFHTAFEGIQCRFCQLVSQSIFTTSTEGIFSERNFHCKHLHNIQLERFVVHHRACLRYKRICCVVNHIGDIHANTLTHKGMVTFCVDDITLLIHHVIVLNEAFTHAEVVFFHFLLRAFNGIGHHVMLDHLSFLDTHLIHESC